jgi:hypothetical protein
MTSINKCSNCGYHNTNLSVYSNTISRIKTEKIGVIKPNVRNVPLQKTGELENGFVTTPRHDIDETLTPPPKKNLQKSRKNSEEVAGVQRQVPARKSRKTSETEREKKRKVREKQIMKRARIHHEDQIMCTRRLPENQSRKNSQT